MLKRKIIVVGGEHHNSLGVIRSLGEAGLKNNIIYINTSDDNNFVCRTKYLLGHNIFTIKENCLVETIRSIAKTQEMRPVLISCGDRIANTIDLNYDNLSPLCILPNAGNRRGGISFYQDKLQQLKLAQECGLTIAKHFIKKPNEIINANLVHYPCIVKSINSLSTDGGKASIKVCYNSDELSEHLNSFDHMYLIIEEFIKKQFEFQLIGCSLDNEIIIPGYTNIIRQPHNTNTGYLKYSPIQDGVIDGRLLDTVREFINKIGYKGLFSAEFIRDDQDNDIFLEINMRNDGNAYCVKAAGVNLPLIWYKYSPCKGLTICEQKSIAKHVYLMPEFSDIYNIKSIGIIRWFKDFLSADAHTIFSIKDIKPFLYVFSQKIINKLRRSFRAN